MHTTWHSMSASKEQSGLCQVHLYLFFKIIQKPRTGHSRWGTSMSPETEKQCWSLVSRCLHDHISEVRVDYSVSKLWTPECCYGDKGEKEVTSLPALYNLSEEEWQGQIPISLVPCYYWCTIRFLHMLTEVSTWVLITFRHWYTCNSKNENNMCNFQKVSHPDLLYQTPLFTQQLASVQQHIGEGHRKLGQLVIRDIYCRTFRGRNHLHGLLWALSRCNLEGQQHQKDKGERMN